MRDRRALSRHAAHKPGMAIENARLLTELRARTDDLKPFCECAWGVLRKSESAVNISLDLVKIDDHKPKIMSACGKLRPQG